MEPGQFAKEIRKFCEDNADETLVKKYSRYFVEGYDAFGVPQKLMEVRRDMWLKENKAELGLNGFLDLGDLLMATGKYEEASFAIWFAASFRKEFTPATLDRFGKWLDSGVRNWAHSDVLCSLILSDMLCKGVYTYIAYAPWRRAESKWKRRAIPVSLIKFLPKCTNIQEILDFLSPMMTQPEKVVHQGLGWFLREAWKIYPEPVENFLLDWKETAPRLIFQYATEKMSAIQKARFKRSKK
jgi:3-methyladenine DNA glycosylase AlkD